MNPLEVRAVSKRFGETVALDSVSLDATSGELLGLVGPDGGGKTTLFRILTTLLLPDSGSASVLGLNVVKDFWAIRAKVGYMPGRFSLYPDLSVEENLDFFASVFGTTRKEGASIIAPIYGQIEKFRDRRAGALSGGMKQKLALSCSLVHRPEILFLDEPTTGVDAVSRKEFWDLLAGLRDSGLTIIVSTPYMDEASRCNRVALMQQGKILAIDEPHKIGNRFKYPLFAVKRGTGLKLINALREYPHVRSVYPFGEDLHYADSRTDASKEEIEKDLAEYAASVGLDRLSIKPIEPGIEDAFMELMGAPASVAA